MTGEDRICRVTAPFPGARTQWVTNTADFLALSVVLAYYFASSKYGDGEIEP